MRRLVMVWAFNLGLCVGAAQAQTPPEPCPPCRAPYCPSIAPWARPGRTPDYGGYYVGGGCAWFGDPRLLHEGTWGWDYFGRHFSRNVILKWCHCRRYQGGPGQYQTDGPHLHPRYEKE